MLTEFKLALIQLTVGASKADNLIRAAQFIKEAAVAGAQLVTLPECFNSPYGTGGWSAALLQLDFISVLLFLSLIPKSFLPCNTSITFTYSIDY